MKRNTLRRGMYCVGALILLVLASCGGSDEDGAKEGTGDQNLPPIASFTATPGNGMAPLQIAFDGSASDDPDGAIADYAWAFGDGDTAGGATTSHTYVLAGNFTAVLTVTDDQGATDSVSATITVTAPAANQAPTASFTATPLTGDVPLTVNFDAGASSDPDGAIADYAWAFGDGDTAGGATTSHTYVLAGNFTAVLTVTDDQGATDTASVTITATAPSGLPPDPAAVALPVDPTVATSVYESTAFLYTGPNAIQTGVTAGTIEGRRAAVIRGRVTERSGEALAGVRITVLRHVEFGQTLTREDGAFDLAVNGGGVLTVDYAKPGYLGAQRQVDVPWQDYAWLPEVVMLPTDTAVTAVDLGAPGMKVARGSPVTDEDGTRQATLLIPAGTTAELVLGDGTTQPLPTASIRATEFTVGEGGPSAMPAQLPPTSGYTYALEYTVDEALGAGATEVRFNRPVYHVVENFIGFPVGSAVPTGYYDRTRGQWVASENGRVIQVLSISGGLAELDADGDGAADSAAQLSALNISDAERAQLASLYTVGQTLWRVPITHFTPWDCNWPYGPPPGAVGPRALPRNPRKPDKPCTASGSIIKCQNQTLGETIPITGTPYALVYQSDRVPGNRDAYTWDIHLTDGEVPADLLSVELEIDVAGKQLRESFPPSANLSYPFEWDGEDAYGRVPQGAQPITVKIGYSYQGRYYPVRALLANSFARVMGQSGSLGIYDFTNMRSLQEITIWSQVRDLIGAIDLSRHGLGGWSLNVQHAYDAQRRALYRGDGEISSVSSLVNAIATVAGTGTSGYNGDSGIATEIQLNLPMDVAPAPDGVVYLADYNNNRIRCITPEGSISTVAGSATIGGYSGDGGLAVNARLWHPRGVAVGPDGSLYIADCDNWVIRRVDPAGVITTFAGSGYVEDEVEGMDIGDGGPATGAILSGPGGVSVAPDGSVYVADSGHYRVRRVGPDGIITTVAGTGERGLAGDGGLALEAQLSEVWDVTVGPDGSLYVSDSGNHRIRLISPDGIITTVAGTTAGYSGDGGPATLAQLNSPYQLDVSRDGTLYIADQTNNRIRRVTPDGIITTVAGDGSRAYFDDVGDGGSPLSGKLAGPRGVAIDSQGYIYIADTGTNRIRRVAPSLPGFSATEFAVADEGGDEVYLFDADGRHLGTVDTWTGTPLLVFGYDGDGRLVSVTDRNGQTTAVERDAAGNPVALVAPGGQRTTLSLDGDGYLATVTNPAGQGVGLTYDAGGLLASYTDAENNTTTFAYDALGRLTRETDAAGGVLTLGRFDDANGFTVTKTTALGRVTTYRMEYLPDGSELSLKTFPTGGQSSSTTFPDASTEIIYPDGTLISMQHGPDPRFGMQAPIVQDVSITSPAGLTSEWTNTREATLADPRDPLSLSTLQDTVSINGRSFVYTYDAETGALTETSPTGDRVTTYLDEIGRVSRIELDPEVAPVEISYNPRGLIVQYSQGGQLSTYGYDEFDRVESRTDASGDAILYAYDDANRLTRLTLPSGNGTGFGYDRNGNLTEVEMPNGAVHRLGYNGLEQLASYQAPTSAAVLLRYDADKALYERTLSSGRVVVNDFDTAGRWSGVGYPEATVAFTYNACCEQVESMTWTPSDSAHAPQAVSYGYDGALVTSIAYDGDASANLSYRYTADFFPEQMTLTSGGDSVTQAYEYDADGYLTKSGDFSFARQGPGGLVSRISDGTLVMDVTYDSSGRMASRASTVNGWHVYGFSLARDQVGRIVSRGETIGVTTRNQSYTYDAVTQLLEVNEDAAVVESHSYDVNGNLLDGGAIYDLRDRLLQREGMTYEFDEDGFLARRGEDTFTYSARGELLEFEAGDGTRVTYTYDGLGRRVARKGGQGTYQYLYGDPSQPFLITAVRDPGGTLTLYYHDDEGFLFAMDRGATRYYIAVDQVGSPRVIADGAGAVVKVVTYNAFGVLQEDSAPGFELPFGFAGGLQDTASGLVHFGYRDYEPSTGRWTAIDPVLFEGGQSNLYLYAGNNPLDSRDPLGLWCIGASFYVGIGAGAQVCCQNGSCSYCGEAGLGFGLSANLGSGGAGNDEVSVGAEATAACGPAKVGLECAYGFKCGGKCKVGGRLGPIGWDSDGNAGIGQKPWDANCGTKAKLKYKDCVRW